MCSWVSDAPAHTHLAFSPREHPAGCNKIGQLLSRSHYQAPVLQIADLSPQCEKKGLEEQTQAAVRAGLKDNCLEAGLGIILTSFWRTEVNWPERDILRQCEQRLVVLSRVATAGSSSALEHRSGSGLILGINRRSFKNWNGGWGLGRGGGVGAPNVHIIRRSVYFANSYIWDNPEWWPMSMKHLGLGFSTQTQH